MLFYTVDNITIGRYDELSFAPEKIMRFYFPCPKKILQKQIKNLNKEYNKRRNEKEFMQNMKQNYKKILLINKINNVLPSIYAGFQACYKIAAITETIPESMRELEKLYKEATGRDATVENVNKLPQMIETLTAKYYNNYQEDPIEFDFSDYLLRLEDLLPNVRLREKKLIHLKHYEAMAMKKLKPTKNG